MVHNWQSMKLRPNLSESYNTELVHHIERNENSGAYLSLNQQMNIHSILTSLLTCVSWWAVVCVSLLHLPTDHSQSRVSGRPRVHQAVVWRPAGVRILLPLIERPAALPCAFFFITLLHTLKHLLFLLFFLIFSFRKFKHFTGNQLLYCPQNFIIFLL